MSLTWLCSRCNEELGELNGYCVYCKVKDGTIVYNPDKYFIREIRIDYIVSERAERVSMTPQEELFRELFNHETVLVKDMDVLTLRAHRDELARIAFEARARLTAVDEEEKERVKSSKPKGPTGFARSVNIDETTSEAINTIRERQKKLTGKEKMLAGLIDLYIKGGMTKEEAEKTATSAMGAGAILAKLKDKTSKDIMTGNTTHSPSGSEGFVINKPAEEITNPTKSNPVFNPFEKK